jgi:hypothetical protein
MTEAEKQKLWQELLAKAPDLACFLYRMGLRFNYTLVKVEFNRQTGGTNEI